MRISPTLPILLAATLLFVGCNETIDQLTSSVRGNGRAASTSGAPGAFREIQIDVPAKVLFAESPNYGYTMQTEENLKDHIQFKVVGNVLTVTSDVAIRPTREFTIYLTAPRVNAVTVSGSGSFETQSIIQNDLGLLVSGSGSIKASVNNEVTNGTIEGSGEIRLQGNTTKAECSIGGSGNINAYPLSAQSVLVSIEGSGDVEVSAVRSITASITGSGDVRYKGPAQESNTTITGTGTLAHVE